MVLLCELMTEEPEGGSAMVPLKLFLTLYRYLAELDCGPVDPLSVVSPPPPVPEENESLITFTREEDSDTSSVHTWDSAIGSGLQLLSMNFHLVIN
jgi:hypothetical protein